MENASKQLAEQYRRLGGRRIAVIDDNLCLSRERVDNTPEAARPWSEQIVVLSDRQRRDVETFLSSLDDESDEPASH